MFSSRTLEDDEALAAELGGRTRAGTPLEATNFGEALLLSVPYGAVPSIGKQLGGALKGKIVIDTSNPYPPRDGEIATVAEEKGAGLTSAELLPGARIVRAFNAIPWALVRVAYQNPGRVAMPMAGDDKEALDVASRLVRDVGYVPVVVGDLKFGRHLVPGSPLAGEHSPEEVQQIAAKLER
jgi:predicted dinucleotide-binding enzyme